MPVTDEEIIRDLMRRYTDDMYPPVSIVAAVAGRQRRRERRRRVEAAGAAAAALGIAISLIAIVPAGGPRPAAASQHAIRLTAAQHVLYKLGTAAAGQPLRPGRYVVLSEKEDGNLDTSVIDSVTGDMWSYQKGANGAPSGSGAVARHWSPTAAQFAAMPLAPAALRGTLISQYDRQEQQQAAPAVTASGKTHPQRKPGLTETADDKVFQQAVIMLWNPLVPPQLRSALFRVLAATPGVTVNASARDTAGRAAVEISRADSVSGVIFAAYEDPRTSAVLELTNTYQPLPRGSAVGYDLMLSITRMSAVPADPYSG